MLCVQKYLGPAKQKTVNLDLLFNTSTKNKNARTTTFMTRSNVEVKHGEFTPVTGTCNGVPITCNQASEQSVTADYPLWVNEIFDDCSFDEVSNEAIADQVKYTGEDWVLKEAGYAYANFNGTDITNEIDTETSINYMDAIKIGIQKMVDNGYSKRNLIVAIDEIVELEIDANDLACCDIGVRTSDAKTTAAKKFGVQAVVPVPRNILSAKMVNGVLDISNPTDPTEIVMFRIYVKEYHMLFDYCKDNLRVESFTDQHHSDVTRIFGKELLGFFEYDSPNSEVHAYMEGITNPAIGTLTEGTPTVTEIPFTYDYSAGSEDINLSKIEITTSADTGTVIDSISPLTEGTGTAGSFTGLTTATEYIVTMYQDSTALSTFTITTA